MSGWHCRTKVAGVNHWQSNTIQGFQGKTKDTESGQAKLRRFLSHKEESEEALPVT